MSVSGFRVIGVVISIGGSQLLPSPDRDLLEKQFKQTVR